MKVDNKYLIKRIQRLEAVLGTLITWLPELGELSQKSLINKLIKPICGKPRPVNTKTKVRKT